MEYLNEEHFEVAKQHGINYQTLYARVYNYGWDIEEAITTPTMNKFGNPKNEIFTKEELQTAENNGLNYKTVYARVKLKGWSIEKAIHTPKKHSRRKYPDHVIQRAAEHGVSYDILKQRISKLKWDLEKAITTPPMDKHSIGKMNKGVR